MIETILGIIAGALTLGTLLYKAYRKTLMDKIKKGEEAIDDHISKIENIKRPDR